MTSQATAPPSHMLSPARGPASKPTPASSGLAATPIDSRAAGTPAIASGSIQPAPIQCRPSRATVIAIAPPATAASQPAPPRPSPAWNRPRSSSPAARADGNPSASRRARNGSAIKVPTTASRQPQITIASGGAAWPAIASAGIGPISPAVTAIVLAEVPTTWATLASRAVNRRAPAPNAANDSSTIVVEPASTNAILSPA
jgi:hypothetical protein